MNAERLIRQIKTGSTDEAFAAADQLDQLSRREPDQLWLVRSHILELIRDTVQPGVQWHLAEVAPRLRWSESEAATLIDWFSGWITTAPSRIVKADALSAICYLAHQHPDYMPIAKRYLARALKFGSPAEQARARKLIGRVEPPEV